MASEVLLSASSLFYIFMELVCYQLPFRQIREGEREKSGYVRKIKSRNNTLGERQDYLYDSRNNTLGERQDYASAVLNITIFTCLASIQPYLVVSYTSPTSDRQL